MLGLVGDIASCIGPYIKELLRQQFIERMIIMLQSDPEGDTREIA